MSTTAQAIAARSVRHVDPRCELAAGWPRWARNQNRTALWPHVRARGPAGKPTCPSWLDANAKSAWRQLVPMLDGMGVLSRVDRDADAVLPALVPLAQGRGVSGKQVRGIHHQGRAGTSQMR